MTPTFIVLGIFIIIAGLAVLVFLYDNQTRPSSAHGIRLYINGAIELQVQEVHFPGWHGSDGFAAVATGKRRRGAMQATLFWDSDAATHAAVLAALDSDEAQTVSIEDPDGDEVIEFKAHIEKICRSRISQQQDAYKATVDIHPTGTVYVKC